MRRIIFVVLGLALPSQAALAGGQAIEFLDRVTLSGRVVSLTDKQLVFEEAGEEKADVKVKKIPLDEISRVYFSTAKDAFAKKGRAVVETNFGDVWGVKKIQLADGLLICASVDLPEGELKIPIEAVRRILLPASNEIPATINKKISAGKEYHAGSRDMLIVESKEGAWKSPRGVLLKITDSKIFFRYRQTDRTIDRKTVRAVILSEPVKAEKLPAGYLTTSDGSRYGFESLKIEGKTVLLESLLLGQLRFGCDSVAEVRFLSDRVVYLTDLTPSEVTERGFFDTTFNYRTGRSVGGGPIRLGGRTYKNGLGLHSYTKLTYDLGRKFKTFIAVVGIDDAARLGGNASFKIMIDGKKKFGPVALTGLDKPRNIRVNITGVDKLAIEVDFGSDGLDTGDHVDIANPKLIKNK